MATLDLKYGDRKQQPQAGITGRTIVYATVAAITLTGPLLAMMGLTFLATVTLLLVTSPLFIIFSPLLFCAGVGFCFVMTGFGLTAAMALAGVSTLSLALRTGVGASSGVVLQQPKGFDQFSPDAKAIRG